jgi:hypothetical protein
LATQDKLIEFKSSLDEKNSVEEQSTMEEELKGNTIALKNASKNKQSQTYFPLTRQRGKSISVPPKGVITEDLVPILLDLVLYQYAPLQTNALVLLFRHMR